jgi:hypothetical protein
LGGCVEQAPWCWPLAAALQQRAGPAVQQLGSLRFGTRPVLQAARGPCDALLQAAHGFHSSLAWPPTRFPKATAVDLVSDTTCMHIAQASGLPLATWRFDCMCYDYLQEPIHLLGAPLGSQQFPLSYAGTHTHLLVSDLELAAMSPIIRRNPRICLRATSGSQQ